MNKELLQKVPGLNVYHAGSVAFTRLTPGDPAAQSTTVATRLLPEGASPSLDIELRSALVESPRDRNLTRRCPDDPATVAATPLPQEVLVHSPTSPVSMPGFLRAALRWRCS